MSFQKATLSITRRDMLGMAAVGAIAVYADKVSAQLPATPPIMSDPALDKLIAGLKPNYISATYSASAKFKPHPADIPPDQLRDLGLDPATWQLEILPAEKTKAQVGNPLSKETGTALTYAALLKMGETKAVRFLAGRVCTFGGNVTRVGMWEGVPLRDVIALAKPGENIRRVFYPGFGANKHAASLSLDRVLEDPPGMLPIILAYKYNGSFLTVKQGGPVGIMSAEDQANRSVKWVTRIFLTDSFKASDTYAGGTGGGNDTGCPLQSAAVIDRIDSGKGGKLAIVGRALAGMGGISKIQYAICPEAKALPPEHKNEQYPWAGDFLTDLDWRDAKIAPPPTDWGGGFPGGKLPPTPLQFDKDGVPLYWPLRFINCQWAAIARDVAPGKYVVYCRAVDLAGNAQPMPRPFDNSGGIRIDKRTVTVAA